MIPSDWIVPDWPAPGRVKALVTPRTGGVGRAPYASFNLATHVGDDPLAVAENRARLRRRLPAEPRWLEQVHGVAVAELRPGSPAPAAARADAAFTHAAGVVCAVLTADCLPVLFCDRGATVVAAAHAGWRGLAAGVLEATVARLGVPAESLIAWLGPAIGPAAFEVGDEVREAFVGADADAAEAFAPASAPGKWMADLYRLARLRLAAAGVREVRGGGLCTYGAPERFFSYRRDGTTGRFATLVWMEEGD